MSVALPVHEIIAIKVWGGVRPRFPTHVITIHAPTFQTDRQTDGGTPSDLNTALCTIVHRAVKKRSVSIADDCYCAIGAYCESCGKEERPKGKALRKRPRKTNAGKWLGKT